MAPIPEVQAGDCEAQCLKDFAAYLKWIFHAKLLFLIL